MLLAYTPVFVLPTGHYILSFVAASDPHFLIARHRHLTPKSIGHACILSHRPTSGVTMVAETPSNQNGNRSIIDSLPLNDKYRTRGKLRRSGAHEVKCATGEAGGGRNTVVIKKPRCDCIYGVAVARWSPGRRRSRFTSGTVSAVMKAGKPRF